MNEEQPTHIAHIVVEQPALEAIMAYLVERPYKEVASIITRVNDGAFVYQDSTPPEPPKKNKATTRRGKK